MRRRQAWLHVATDGRGLLRACVRSCAVCRQGKTVMHSVCGIGWGLGGKLAEESEALRDTFGPARYLISGIKSFVKLRGCPGILELLIPRSFVSSLVSSSLVSSSLVSSSLVSSSRPDPVPASLPYRLRHPAIPLPAIRFSAPSSAV